MLKHSNPSSLLTYITNEQTLLLLFHHHQPSHHHWYYPHHQLHSIYTKTQTQSYISLQHANSHETNAYDRIHAQWFSIQVVWNHTFSNLPVLFSYTKNENYLLCFLSLSSSYRYHFLVIGKKLCSWKNWIGVRICVLMPVDRVGSYEIHGGRRCGCGCGWVEALKHWNTCRWSGIGSEYQEWIEIKIMAC